MRLPRLSLLVASACLAAGLRAASIEERVEALFRPLLDERMALSSDGQRIAYTTHGGRELAIVVMSVEPPGPKRTVNLEADRDPASAAEKPPMELRFLRWA